MYLHTFRLARAPFDAHGDVETVYVGPVQQEALATLGQACAEEDTLTLVTAPDGCGKSTLLDKFLADLDDSMVWSEVRGRGMDPTEFLHAAVLGFGFEDCAVRYEQLRHILEVYLGYQRRRGVMPVLVVEDAQNLSPQVLEEIRWLAGLDVEGHAAVNVVLSGLPELERIVHAPAMEVLSARRRHRLQIKALSEQETRAYIHHRLAAAGATDPHRLFAAEAVPIVHRYTGGIPGLVNTLCETALSCAAGVGERLVGRTAVEAAIGRLHLVCDAGVTRVQGMRSADAKAVRQDELARLIVTRHGVPVREFRATKERVLIGRKPSNDLQLDGRGVSRHHALMLLDVQGWWLIDLHSCNGTYINSRRIRQQRISDNDVVRIADFHVRCQHRFLPHPLTSPAEAEDGPETGATVVEPAPTRRRRPWLVKSN